MPWCTIAIVFIVLMMNSYPNVEIHNMHMVMYIIHNYYEYCRKNDGNAYNKNGKICFCTKLQCVDIHTLNYWSWLVV